ncbi:MAG: TetR-like C-terminal domain-containing protein [Streptosporangiaceae bacterium]
MNLTKSDTTLQYEAVHEAVLSVFAERTYRGLTHMEVAARSGTDAGALLLRWPELADLLVDALIMAVFPSPEDPGDRGLRSELIEITDQIAREFSVHGEVLVAVLSQLQANPELDRAFRERFLRPRVECAKKVFGRAMLRGELRPGADPHLVFSVVPSLLAYRTMVRDPAPDPSIAEHLVDTLMLPLLLRS